jgi:hypothetical protein
LRTSIGMTLALLAMIPVGGGVAGDIERGCCCT